MDLQCVHGKATATPAAAAAESHKPYTASSRPRRSGEVQPRGPGRRVGEVACARQPVDAGRLLLPDGAGFARLRRILAQAWVCAPYCFWELRAVNAADSSA